MNAHIFRTHDGAPLLWVPNSVSFFRLAADSMEFLGRFIEPDGHSLSPDSECLYDWGIGDDLDAPPAPLNEEFAPEISGFRVVLTEACNFACPGCFSTTAIEAGGARLKTMSRETLDLVISRIAKFARHRELAIHFFGGEPLLRFKEVRHAVSKFEDLVERGAIIRPSLSITTNAFTVPDAVVDCLVKYRVRVGVSIEETEEIHDVMRPVRRTMGSSFSQVSSNYKRMWQAGVDVHVLVTPQVPVSLEFPKRFRTMLEMFPMRTVTINTPYEMHSLGWQVGSEFVELLIQCHRIAAERGVEVESALTPCIAAIATGQRRRSPQSRVGTAISVAVDTDGNLVRSTHKWSKPLLVSEWDELKTEVRRTPECLACVAVGLCGGPNEEYQRSTASNLDTKKCSFFRALPGSIARNLVLFEA